MKMSRYTLVLLISTAMAVPFTSAAGERIEGTVTHVRDVDTIEVNHRPIRFDGIDGPEMDERGGRAAKDWMVRQVIRKRVTCTLTGAKTYDRWVGTCYNANGEDLSALAVSNGHARDCPRYSKGKYRRFETDESRRHLLKDHCR